MKQIFQKETIQIKIDEFKEYEEYINVIEIPDFSKLEAGMRIQYIGDSFSFGGSYRLVNAESTYVEGKCPDDEKGKLMIIEFMNDGTPMYFQLEDLNPTEWKTIK